jgi:membrane protein
MTPSTESTSSSTPGKLTLRQFLVRTWKQTGENEILTRASAVSFYAMIALVPLLAVLLTVVVQLLPDLSGVSGKVVGFGNLTVDQLRASLQQALPAEGYQVVADQIGRMQSHPPFGLLSIGLLISLWSASSLYLAIIDAMNRVYGLVETRSFLKLRLIAILMTVVQAAIFLVALIVIVAGPQVLRYLGLKGNLAVAGEVTQWVVVVLVLLYSFALTYYVGPDSTQRWRRISLGSVIGVIVFLAFTYVFRIYVQHFGNYDKTYGSLGGVMILLLWFWVSSVVLLLGGQINKVIDDAKMPGSGSGSTPNPAVSPDRKTIEPKPLSD